MTKTGTIDRSPLEYYAIKNIIVLASTKYLTWIYLGGVLAFISVGNIVRKPGIFVLTVVKMLALPVLAYFLPGFFCRRHPG